MFIHNSSFWGSLQLLISRLALSRKLAVVAWVASRCKIGPNLQILLRVYRARAHNNSATTACTKLPWVPCSNLQISYLFRWTASTVHDRKEITHSWHSRKIGRVFLSTKIFNSRGFLSLSSNWQQLYWHLPWDSWNSSGWWKHSACLFDRCLSSSLLDYFDLSTGDYKYVWTIAIWTAKTFWL